MDRSRRTRARRARLKLLKSFANSNKSLSAARRRIGGRRLLASRSCALLIEGCGLQLMDRTGATARGRILLASNSGRLACTPVRRPRNALVPNLHHMGKRQSRHLAALLCAADYSLMKLGSVFLIRAAPLSLPWALTRVTMKP